MFTRTFSRWIISLVTAVALLVVINTLLTRPIAQAKRAAITTTCLGSIQACIDAAVDGDTILIPEGTYTESLTLSKPVSLTGVNSTTTIIHAVAGQRVLTVTGATITNSVVISGLTFTGGSADYGGGVLITDTARPLIRDSIFISNDARISGGGLYAQSDLTLAGGHFMSNTATEFGGGIYAVEYLTMTKSEFMGNHTIGTSYWRYGGGIYAQMDTRIANSRFIQNGATFGGGIYITGSRLTLIDTDFSANEGGGTYAYSVDNNSTVRVEGGSFTNHSSGSALTVRGSLEVTSTQFISNSGGSFDSAAVAVTAGPATFINAYFENNNYADGGGSGGGIDFEDSYEGHLTLSNTTFVSNAGVYGGAVSAGGTSIISIFGGRLERNTATAGSGGLFAQSGSQLLMNGTEVISNTSGGIGGAGGVAVILGVAHVSNSHFENNVSSGDKGGGLYASTLYLTNSQFISNTSLLSAGGGAQTGEAYLTGGRFERNYSEYQGGGLFAMHLVMSGTVFISNTSTTSGGGVQMLGDAVLTGGRFENNRVTATTPPGIDIECRGGGLAVASGALTLTGTQFIGNSTPGRGGGLCYDYSNSDGHIVNALFVNNIADIDGAAIAINAPGQHELLHLTIAGSTYITKPAIAIYSGTVGITNSIVVSHPLVFSISGGTVYEDYNLFFGHVVNISDGITSGGHSLLGDPMHGNQLPFVNPLNGDYHLRFPSPAIDHGANVGVYTDLDGDPRPVNRGFDIGAYEYQGPIAYLFLPIVRK